MNRLRTFVVLAVALAVVSTRLYSQGDTTAVKTVTLNNAGVATSGLSLQGTITLNRTAVQPVVVQLGMTGAASGISLSTPSVTINAAQSTGSFEVRSTATTAGCAMVTAVVGTTVKQAAHAVFSPPPPSDAGFSFVTPRVVYWPVPGSGNATITLSTGDPTRTTTITSPTKTPTIATTSVALTSSNPSVIAVPATVTARAFVSNTVPLKISNFGCSVLTATRDGKSVRQAILSRFSDGG